LAHIMDTVSNILGGDTTLHVTKHPDGTVEVTHDPSTTGEKWGRIAQAALGGAAKGMEVGQGPGGPARAAAGGIQTGMAQPQQRLDAANTEAAIEQKQLQDRANLVLTQQKLVTQILANKAAGLKLSQEEQDQSNDEQDRYVNSPNSVSLGTFGSVHEAATSPNAALILKNHPDGTLRTATAFDKDGNITGVHAYVVDRDWGNRRNDKPAYYPEQVASDPDGKPKFEQRQIPINGDINSKIDTFVTGKQLAAAKINADWATQQSKQQPKTADEQIRAKYNLMYPNDPVRAAQEATHEIENTPAIRAEIAAHQATAAAEMSRAGLQDAQTDQIKNNKPGGTPQPVDDPKFPPASNFDPGTEGINPMPKTGYKIPADTEKAARLSRNIQHNGKVIVDIMNRRPDLVGTINSLGTNWHQKVVGTKDPDLAALDGAVDQLAIASAGAHGSRSAALIEGIHDGVLNQFKNGPAAVKAYTQGQMNSVQTFLDEENNYRHYGDAVGPSAEARARAVARAPQAPGAAPQSGGGAAAGGAAGGGAAAGGATPAHAPAVRDPKGNITPPPGAVPGFKNGQLVGYRDANGWHE